MTPRPPALVPARTALLFAVAVAALAALPLLLGLSPYSHNLVTLTFLMVSGALAWNWMGGYVGQVSFGHAAMFGLGGFVAARLMLLEPAPPAPLAWLVGGLAAGVFALGAHPTLRLRGRAAPCAAPGRRPAQLARVDCARDPQPVPGAGCARG